MPLTAIALIGAAGNLGPSVLHALLSATNPTLAITVITRQSSQSTYPPTVTVKTISDNDPTQNELIAVLTGQHALITTFGGTNTSALQLALADAFVSAGVQRFIPADFGSCDSSSDLAQQLMPLYREKAKVRTYLQHLAHTSNLTWTSLVTGHFFDFGLSVEPRLLLMDPTKRKATIIEGGTTMFSTSTLTRVGEAVVSILRNETLTRNKMLYVQSFCITQRQLLAVCEKIQGGRKWEVEEVRSEDFIKINKTKMDNDHDDHDARENLVGVVGIIDGDWRQRQGFANEMLGLKEQDLEAEVRKVLERRK